MDHPRRLPRSPHYIPPTRNNREYRAVHVKYRSVGPFLLPIPAAPPLSPISQLANLVGFKQQFGAPRHLLYRRRHRSALSRPLQLEQQPLASQQHLHSRDIQWFLRLNRVAREHLFLGSSPRTFWRDIDSHSRRYWRVYRYLRLSGIVMYVPEVERLESS